jgi:hypothetical protein
MQALLEWR